MMGLLLRGLAKELKPYTKDDRRRDFQKQQWRRRVDAQMKAARSGQPPAVSSHKFNVICPKCRAALISPLGDNIKCPQCGFRMRVYQTTPSPALRAPSPSDSTASELERLAKLRKSGGLTDEEFAAAKAKVLGT